MPRDAPKRKKERAERLQVYLTRSVPDDRLLLDVWESCRDFDRPQEVFRSMLVAGLRAMAEEGTVPEPILRAVPAISGLVRRDVPARVPSGFRAEAGRPANGAGHSPVDETRREALPPPPARPPAPEAERKPPTPTQALRGLMRRTGGGIPA